jgi:anaerobic selenocysteine-containing dehydrogenase
MATFSSTPISSHLYQVKVGGDAAVLKGMMKALLDMDDHAIAQDSPRVLDIEFIAGHTTGFKELEADLRTTSWDAIVAQSGLSQPEIEAAAIVRCRSGLQSRCS